MSTTRNERDDRTIDEWQQGVPHPDDRPTKPQDDHIETPGDASTYEDVSVQAAQADAEERTEGQRTFGKLSPSEAASLRWAKVREREAAGIAPDDPAQEDVKLVRVTVRTGRIIKRLAKDAEAGDSRAARELRAWMAEVQADRDTDVSTLDRATRQRLLARLLDEEYGEADIDELDDADDTPTDGDRHPADE